MPITKRKVQGVVSLLPHLTSASDPQDAAWSGASSADCPGPAFNTI